MTSMSLSLGLDIGNNPTRVAESDVIARVMANSGVLYNTTDPSSLRIDRAGALNVGTPGDLDVTGLILDKASGPEGTEKIVDGDFDDPLLTNWTPQANSGSPPTLEWRDGVVRITLSADGTFQRMVQFVTGLTVGAWYRVSGQLVGRSSDFKGRLTGSALPSDDIDSGTGPMEFYFKASSVNQTLTVSLPINVGAGEWIEFDKFSCKRSPGHHAQAGSDSTRGTWTTQLLPGVPLLGTNGLDDYYVTAIPSTTTFAMARLAISNSSSTWAPIFCNEAANTMNLRRAGANANYYEASAGDFVYDDVSTIINGVATNVFTYDTMHTVEVSKGSLATAGVITRLFGNVTLSRYLAAGTQALIFLPSAPSAGDLALYRAWMASL